MGWSIVGVSNQVEVTGTSHTLVTTGISGLAQGDLLVACIASRIASTTSISTPAPWTRVTTVLQNNTATNTSAAATAYMAYTVRGTSDPANMTFTHPVAPSVAIGRIVAYRGCITAGAAGFPLNDFNSGITATNTTACTWTGISTLLKDTDLVVAMIAGGQESTWSVMDAAISPSVASGATDTTTQPTVNTWIERADANTTTGADTSLAIFDGLLTVGTTNTGQLSATASQGAAQSMIIASFTQAFIPDLTMPRMVESRARR